MRLEVCLSRVKMNRRQFLAGSSLSGAALALAACSPQPPAGSAPPATTPVAASQSSAPPPTQPAATSAPSTTSSSAASQGGKLIIGQAVSITTLDLTGSGNFGVMQATEHIYQPLTIWDESGALRPGLAESWESIDPHTWVFRLRKGVKWHNGREFVASDVAYWHSRVTDPEVGLSRAALFSIIKQVDVVDEHTVRMTTSRPYGPLPDRLAGILGGGMVNKETVEQFGDLKTHALGTGPFKLADHKPDDYLRYVRNPDYWEQGLPRMDEFTLKLMPEEDQRIAALRAGQIHLAPVSAIGAQRLEGDKTVTVMRSPMVSLWQVLINAQVKPLNDLRVRKALSLALDRRAILDKVGRGLGALSGPIPTGYGDWSIPEDKLPYKQDLEGAKKLLAEPGLASGFPLTMHAATNFPEKSAIAVELKNQLKAINVDLKIELIEAAQDSRLLNSGSVTEPLDYQLIASIFNFYPDPNQYLGNFLPERNQINRPGNTAISDATLTDLLAKAESTANVDERKRLYFDVQMRMLNDVIPCLWIYNAQQVDGVSTRLSNYKQSFTGFRYRLKEAAFA